MGMMYVIPSQDCGFRDFNQGVPAQGDTVSNPKILILRSLNEECPSLPYYPHKGTTVWSWISTFSLSKMHYKIQEHDIYGTWNTLKQSNTWE